MYVISPTFFFMENFFMKKWLWSQSYDCDLQRQRCKFLQCQTQRCKTNPTIFLRCNYNAGVVNFTTPAYSAKSDVSCVCGQIILIITSTKIGCLQTKFCDHNINEKMLCQIADNNLQNTDLQNVNLLKI
jgi:hypothetical protein